MVAIHDFLKVKLNLTIVGDGHSRALALLLKRVALFRNSTGLNVWRKKGYGNQACFTVSATFNDERFTNLEQPDLIFHLAVLEAPSFLVT